MRVRESNPQFQLMRLVRCHFYNPRLFGGGWEDRTPNSGLQSPRVPISTNPPNMVRALGLELTGLKPVTLPTELCPQNLFKIFFDKLAN